MAAQPPPLPLFNVHDQMVFCDVDDQAQFDGQTPAERIARDIFGDDYASCMDKTIEELDSDFKSYSDLTQAQGQIRLNPGVKGNIKAFCQWVRDETRLGRDAGSIAFNVLEAPRYWRRYKTHEKFVEKSSTIAEAAKPSKFTSEMKWADWSPTFLNYLRAIPGRGGIPLKYICRPLDAPNPAPNADFLDDYVNMAPLAGEAFTIDAAEVHTLIVNFISGNEAAESKIQAHSDAKNGRLDYNSLVEHYEGVGLHAIDLTKADATLLNLFYGGEKKPHMWWAEFERQLTDAYTTYDKKESRQVHSKDMKLRTLLSKVNADFLQAVKAGISIRLSEIPMTMTYEQALAVFRNEVNRKFPPQLGNASRSRRNINEVQRYGEKRRGGRNNGHKGNGKKPKKTRTDSTIITLTDGQQIEYHPAFHFPRHVFSKFKPEDADRLRKAREEYKRNKSQQTQIQELQRQVQQTQTSGSGSNPPADVTVGGSSQVSEMTQGTTMMGGRNEQASQRAAVAAVVKEPPPNTWANNECDTNADTVCLGRNFVILKYTTRTADVYAYDKSYKPIEGIPIVTGATAYDDERTGMTYILVFNEALYYGEKLDHTLINPNQVRAYGLDFWDNPYDQQRGLQVCLDDFDIPMRTKGTKVYFKSRTLTTHELQSCTHYVMTSPMAWNPEQLRMSEVASDSRSDPVPYRLAQVGCRKYWEYSDPTSDESLLHSIEPSLVCLKERLISQVMRSVRQVESYDPDLDDAPVRRSFVSTDRHTRITADILADRFCIGPERAKATLRATTQRGTRSAILPLSRRYRADRMFDVKRLSGKFATDTLWAAKKSLKSYAASQIYSHKCGFKAVYHLERANDDAVGYTLSDFINDYGAPEHLTFDGAAVQVGANTRFMKNIRRAEIKYHVSAPRRPNENPAESAIRDVKTRWYRLKTKLNVPDRLWDFGISYICETNNVIVSSTRYANGRTPLEIITGITPDITEYLDFGFYDWVVFRTNAGLGEPSLGRWLGVSHNVGQLMSYWILPISGIPISCTTVQRLTEVKKKTHEWGRKMKQFTIDVEAKCAAKASDVSNEIKTIDPEYLLDLERENSEFLDEYNRVINDQTLKNADDYNDMEVGQVDPYLNMELGLPRGDESERRRATVKRRAVDVEGRPIGRPSDNPLLDSRQYEVEFMDGETEILTANIIAVNLLAQVDEEGHRMMLIDEIEDHRVLEDAIPYSKGTYKTASGMKRKKRTTRGWEILVRWKDGSSDWITLKDLKDSYPVELAEYARNNDLQDEPAFAWWVPFVMKKRTAIISKLKSKHWQKTHKYGIRVPRTIDEAKRIDAENQNTVWMDAIRLEMKNCRIAFETYEGNIHELVGYQEITGHLVFDVKLGENFRRKARYCADGHKTDAPAAVTFSTVVSRDSVRLILTIAALNDLAILGADVQNAFLTAPNLEKVWLTAGPEFGAEQGKNFLVVRALYGLKSASASFRAYMAKKLDEMGFKSSEADADVWLRAASKPDGEQYYEYVLMYVDDILAISMEPQSIMEDIQSMVKFKNDKIEEPSNYLGARLQRKEINDTHCWTITSVDYINAAIKNLEEALKDQRWKLPNKVQTPMTTNYAPELDGTPELEDQDLQFYQELIGMLRWATEIGRVDVLLETSLLSQYQASPREGHLEQALHIWAYLRKKPKLTLYMDASLPNVDYAQFTTRREEFQEQYRGATEELPHNQPRPRGRSVVTTAFVDASHASNKKTRKSHTGFIIFVNRAPIFWFSKRQQTVEASTFSSELLP